MKLGKVLLASVPVFAGLHGCEVVPREVPQYTIPIFLFPFLNPAEWTCRLPFAGKVRRQSYPC